jgi:hypothetical protein
MRVQKRIPWLMSLGAVLAAMALGATQAGADSISDRPGSVVIWPKVIADGTRDTLIALTNTKNTTAYAYCEYVVGTGTCLLTTDYCSVNSDCPEINPPNGPANPCVITWGTRDFSVILTKQQPTIWRVSTGRVENLFLPDNGECMTFVLDGTLRESCPGFFQVGQGGGVPVAPPAPLVGTDEDDPTFRGELRCIQTNVDGSPVAANALKGEAIIETVFPPSNNISKYNSINITGLVGVDADSPTVVELNGINYNACPEAIEATHYAPGASDLVADELGATCTTSDCAVRTEITIVPCRANFLEEEGSRFNVGYELVDEFESAFTAAGVYDCWANVDVASLNVFNINSASFFHTRMNSIGSGLCIEGTNAGLLGCTSDTTGNLGGGLVGCGVGGVCAPISGILAVVEEFHSTDASQPVINEFAGVGTNASNAFSIDSNRDGSIQRPGRCRITTPAQNAQQAAQLGCADTTGPIFCQCTNDAQCPTGRCRIATATMCSDDTQCPGVDDFCDRCMNDEITFDGTIP